MDAESADLQEDLRLRVSHVARSWGRRHGPLPMAGEIGRPEVRLDIGVVGSDDINECRSTKHKLQ